MHRCGGIAAYCSLLQSTAVCAPHRTTCGRHCVHASVLHRVAVLQHIAVCLHRVAVCSPRRLTTILTHRTYEGKWANEDMVALVEATQFVDSRMSWNVDVIELSQVGADLYGKQYSAWKPVCCGVLQCVAVCCSVVSCCCSVLYCAVCCVHGNRCVAVCCSVLSCCSVLQYVAVCCSGLQCVAVCCCVLLCVAVCFGLGVKLCSLLS